VTRGVLIFAHDNTSVRYSLLASACAALVRANMGCKVALAADHHTLQRVRDEGLLRAFDHLIKVSSTTGGRRLYGGQVADYLNASRPSAYRISPFDETILMDADYMVLDDSLNHCWGSNQDIMIARDAVMLDHLPAEGPDAWVSRDGLRMAWATVLYFKRTDRAAKLFEIMDHVRVEREYYSAAFRLPEGPFRNDHALAVAVHVLQGHRDDDSIARLPCGPLLTATVADEMVGFSGGLPIFLARHRRDWEHPFLYRARTSVHVMDKISYLRHAKDVIYAH
jgi:hypothetical protein